MSDPQELAKELAKKILAIFEETFSEPMAGQELADAIATALSALGMAYSSLIQTAPIPDTHKAILVQKTNEQLLRAVSWQGCEDKKN